MRPKLIHQERNKSCCDWLKRTQVNSLERIVCSDGRVFPKSRVSNKADNSKYNFFTFIPMVFYHQFKHFLNLYFLMIALLQFVPSLRVGFLVTYITPIAIILAVSYAKEFWDEVQRKRKDEAFNSEMFTFSN